MNARRTTILVPPLDVDLARIDPPVDLLNATSVEEWRRLRALPVSSAPCGDFRCCGNPHTLIAVADVTAIRALLHGCLYADRFFFHRFEFRMTDGEAMDRLQALYL